MMNTTSTTTISSTGSVVPPETAEKPQGWKCAQLMKRGYFRCIFDCDVYFRTKEEANNHYPCPNRTKCDEAISTMDAVLRDPGAVKYKPLEKWTERETEKFRKHLKRLPQSTKDELVMRFLQNNLQNSNRIILINDKSSI